MQVQYVGGSDRLEIARGLTADRDGDPVEVSDELGKELVGRGDFKQADKPRAKAREKE
jgi:hypothetical protein